MAISVLSLYLLLPLLSLIFFLSKKLTNQKPKHLPPPTPPTLPILGNLHQLGQLPHQSLHRLSKKHGPVMMLHLGTAVKTVIISSAETAKQVLKDHDLACCSRPKSAGTSRLFYDNSDVAFSPYGPYWREMRKICVIELFSIKRVNSFRFVREEEIDFMIESINSVCETPIDVAEKLFSLTANITFRTAFGRSFRGSDFDNERFQKVIHETEGVLGGFCGSDYFGNMGRVLDWVMDRDGKIEKVFKELNGFFTKVIDEHLDCERERKEEDIIDVLLKIEKDQAVLDGGAKFSKNNIKAILLNVFLGGVDTGAITMEWAMTELVRNPRLMKKVQDEIRSYMGEKRKISESDLEHFHYLKMVIKETFRLHPAAPLLLPRESMTHFKINGYDIPPKTLIQVNAWAIGRNPNHWENPDEFYPERFMGSNVDFKGQNFELLPFGGGRRGCPGIYMAMVTIELGLANLLYRFDWKLCDGIKEEDVDMEEASGLSLTVSKKNALKLVPIRYFKCL